MNKLIVIGEMCNQMCYLNLSKEDAIKLHKKRTGETIDPDDIITVEFDQCFWTYSVGEPECYDTTYLL